MGSEAPDRPAERQDVLTRLTLDHDDPAAIMHCVTRARESSRTVRDVLSAEMWEAINTFHLTLLRQDVSAALQAGPYSVYALVRQRCALFWGVTRRTMLRDEAAAFLEAGAAIEAADMVLRMLRVALPPSANGDAESTHLRDGQALAVLQAVGGVQAYRRAVPAPPLAGPSRASCSTRAPTRMPWPRRSTRCTTRSPPPTTSRARRRRSCASGACWPTSSSAPAPRPMTPICLPRSRSFSAS